MVPNGYTSMPSCQQAASLCQQAISVVLSFALVVTSMGLDGCKKGSQPSQAGQQDQAPQATYATPTPDQLYQLVAPIALFPDNLVAQVLAGSTYPDQITSAWQWFQQNSSLKGEQLMVAVDQGPHPVFRCIAADGRQPDVDLSPG
jgi:hypothetical protein